MLILIQNRSIRFYLGIARASVEIPSKRNDDIDSDEEDTTTANTPRAAVKLARRVASDELSDTSTDGTISDDDHVSGGYNSHDLPGKSQDNPSHAIHALAAHVPVAKPDDAVRERIAAANNETQQRSDDIHPIPPITREQPGNNADNTYGRGSSGSEDISGSEEEESSAADNLQPSSTTRPTTSDTTPLGRDNPAPQANARFPAVAAPQNTTTNARFPAAPSTPQNTTTNARFPSGPAANPTRNLSMLHSSR